MLCKILSFLYAYSKYNQIMMNLADAPKTTFVMYDLKFYYKVMPFRLKNRKATYQKLMDKFFSKQVRFNIESHFKDLNIIFN